MHSLYFVMFEKERAVSAGVAGGVAGNILDDEGFCNTGFFGSGRSDRYEIGGRRKGLFEQLFNPDLNLTNISSIATSAILITDELRLKFCIEERSDVQIFDADNYDEICVKDLRSQHNNKRLVIVDYHC